MIEVKVKNKETILNEFKVEQNWERGTLVHKTYICISHISKELADEIKKQVQGDNPTKGFGRFDFEGDVSFNINNFYITLYNVSLSNWTYQTYRGIGHLKINFTPLKGFGYLSGMGLNVMRDQKLSTLLSI